MTKHTKKFAILNIIVAISAVAMAIVMNNNAYFVAAIPSGLFALDRWYSSLKS